MRLNGLFKVLWQPCILICCLHVCICALILSSLSVFRKHKRKVYLRLPRDEGNKFQGKSSLSQYLIFVIRRLNMCGMVKNTVKQCLVYLIAVTQKVI